MLPLNHFQILVFGADGSGKSEFCAELEQLLTLDEHGYSNELGAVIEVCERHGQPENSDDPQQIVLVVSRVHLLSAQKLETWLRHAVAAGNAIGCLNVALSDTLGDSFSPDGDLPMTARRLVDHENEIRQASASISSRPAKKNLYYLSFMDSFEFVRGSPMEEDDWGSQVAREHQQLSAEVAGGISGIRPAQVMCGPLSFWLTQNSAPYQRRVDDAELSEVLRHYVDERRASLKATIESFVRGLTQHGKMGASSYPLYVMLLYNWVLSAPLCIVFAATLAVRDNVNPFLFGGATLGLAAIQLVITGLKRRWSVTRVGWNKYRLKLSSRTFCEIPQAGQEIASEWGFLSKSLEIAFTTVTTWEKDIRKDGRTITLPNVHALSQLAGKDVTLDEQQIGSWIIVAPRTSTKRTVVELLLAAASVLALAAIGLLTVLAVT